ncbi:MAG: alpha/beta fold hydrolase [Anaerolineales bacterium]|jgi:3-oxoadipate enol-lactonase
MFYKGYQNLKLFYQTTGDSKNPAILLIHGLGADHNMWEPQIEPFVEAGFFVITPDMRSHGQSETRAFSIAACARDLEVLLEELKIEKAHLVGVSMGGLIVQQMACDFSKRAHKIIICDSFSGITNFSERFNAQLAAILLAVLPNKLVTKILVSTYQRMGQDDVAAYFAGVLAEADVQNLRAVRKAVNDFNIMECLATVKQPTLVLVGDKFGKMAVEMARKTALGIQGATFHILTGGGDPSNMLVPQEFNRQVLAFFA